jgi:uncharacterized repeat protein (TIGR03803 family)
MRNLNLWKAISLACIFCVVEAIGSPAQDVLKPSTVTFKTLADFDGTDGASPDAGLVQGTSGNFYGIAGGGANNDGTVFKITPAGKLTTLHSFCALTGCADGAGTGAGLVQATDGNFYGTTDGGGANDNPGICPGGCGTVFKITPSGTLTTLYSFCVRTGCTDGAGPGGGLVQRTDGSFYGTTTWGGTNQNCILANGGAGGCGTVFKISPGGTLTTLYSFCAQANCPDGYRPSDGLVQGTDGNFYGTTEVGGANDAGTVFKITPGGALTTLYSFCAESGCSDGGGPSRLVQGTDGNFYGTTWGGGTGQICTSLNVPGCGTVFKITPGGTLTTLYSFHGADGSIPEAGLLQATDGNFYGTTEDGGASNACVTGIYGCGTVFKISPEGKLTTLHNFCPEVYCTDGAGPEAGLIQATDGNLYGSTTSGGDLTCDDPSGCGTVFSLAVGLGPFVETNPTSGVVGASVIILGNNLTGATHVAFNGKAATFKVISSTEITTTVPTGATTGKVSVKTPSRTLTSNVKFRVP